MLNRLVGRCYPHAGCSTTWLAAEQAAKHPSGYNAYCRRAFSTRSPKYSVTPSKSAGDLSTLSGQLKKAIEVSGPLSVATYMRQCLTHPTLGYYNQQTPFGREGDFITSPEISQMFGELVGIWFITQWLSMSQPTSVTLVELGPGKATLLSDLLRAASKFPKFLRSIQTIHLLETSDSLREIQRIKLCGNNPARLKEGIWYGRSTYGPEVCWHADLASVPNDLEHPMILAHEFFDAIPINAFERTEHGWRELLVDYKAVENAPGSIEPDAVLSFTHHIDDFHLTLSKRESRQSMSLAASPRYSAFQSSQRVEVSSEAQAIARRIAVLVAGKDKLSSGAALIIDYGPSQTVPINSLRGIRSHKIVSPFKDPGYVDLSVDVDFEGLASQARQVDRISIHGPVLQSHWLHGLGIEARREILKDKARDEMTKQRVEGEYHRLVDCTGMGKAYKVMAITTSPSSPAGFEKS